MQGQNNILLKTNNFNIIYIFVQYYIYLVKVLIQKFSIFRFPFDEIWENT